MRLRLFALVAIVAGLAALAAAQAVAGPNGSDEAGSCDSGKAPAHSALNRFKLGSHGIRTWY
jgi:hypothetical protein